MLSLGVVASVASAVRYFRETDYYAHEEAPTYWHGHEASDLGLEGVVQIRDFQAVMEGKHGEPFKIASGKGGKRAPGTDATFSAPKSVSITALVYGNTAVLEAHHAAVKEALSFLEKTAAQTRIREKGTVRTEKTGNLLVAQFEHHTSRALDPQLHSHCVIINATKDSHGRWRALDNRGLFENKMLAGAVYRTALARQLHQMGYRTRVTGKNGMFELEGFSEEQLASFSQRRSEIEREMKERGRDGAKEAAAVTLLTRPGKCEIGRDELSARWHAQAAQHGMREPSPGPRDVRKPVSARVAIKEAIPDLFERDSVLKISDFLARVLAEEKGRLSVDELRSGFEQAIKDGELVLLKSAADDPEASHVTPRGVLEQEHRIHDMAKEGRATSGSVLPRSMASMAVAAHSTLRRASLTDGQRAGIEHCLTSRDRFTLLQGDAGVGKTTAMRLLRQIADFHGVEVRGFAVTGTASRELLQSAGIQSTTIATKLLRRPSGLRADRGQLWVVDEASLISAPQAERLMERAITERARVIFVGDSKQMPSVDRGRVFGALCESGLPVVRMSEIVRQTNLDLKKAVGAVATAGEGRDAAALGDAAKAIAPYLVEEPNKHVRWSGVADAYLRSEPDKRSDTLVVTGTHEARKKITEAIRSGLKERGVLRGEGHRQVVLEPVDVTSAKLSKIQSYQAGYHVQFLGGDPENGIDARQYGEILHVDEKSKRYQVLLATGSKKWVSCVATPEVSLYKSETLTVAEGDRVRWRQNDLASSRKNGDIGTVASVTARGMKVAWMDGSRSTVPLGNHVADPNRMWTHGYVSTVASAQGSTASHVLVDVNTKSPTSGYESLYTAFSRPRVSARVFVDDAERMPKVLTTRLQGRAARDLVASATVPRGRARGR